MPTKVTEIKAFYAEDPKDLYGRRYLIFEDPHGAPNRYTLLKLTGLKDGSTKVEVKGLSLDKELACHFARRKV